MAEKRMFSQKIIDSDHFLDMPLSTQSVYFHLSMRADDEGFINNPKKIIRMIGANDDEVKLLIAKNFVLDMGTGVVVIKHWHIHNHIRNDRTKDTAHTKEKAMLSQNENGSYTVGKPSCNQMSTKLQPNVSIEEIRLEEISIESKPMFKSCVFNNDDMNKIINYRKSIKAGIRSQQGYTGLENKIKAVMNKYNIGLDKVLAIMADKEWKSIDVEWVKKLNLNPVKAKNKEVLI